MRVRLRWNYPGFMVNLAHFCTTITMKILMLNCQIYHLCRLNTVSAFRVDALFGLASNYYGTVHTTHRLQYTPIHWHVVYWVIESHLQGCHFVFVTQPFHLSIETFDVIPSINISIRTNMMFLFLSIISCGNFYTALKDYKRHKTPNRMSTI